ncbi:MAG: ribonuclease R [Acidobacteriota bacterium]
MAKHNGTTVTGRLTCHPDGYGFVVVEDPAVKDIFIPPRKMKNATHGDEVLVQILPQRKRQVRGRTRRRSQKGSPRASSGPEGEVVKVISRARDLIVGKLFAYRREFYLAPLDVRYHHSVRMIGDIPDNAREGKIAVINIIVQPSRSEPPMGEIVEVLGDPDDPEIQYKIVCYNHGIPIEFPQIVQEAADGAREPDEEEIASRMDFRDLLTVTIDGETARDFDDAVSIRKGKDGGFQLWVHIADVSHYVRPSSRLDQEALARGTSVYFPDRAIPMLPRRLSNELCSLNPQVDRLTVTVEMAVNNQGEIRHASFHKSIIRSNERMTYTQVAGILVGRDPELQSRYRYLLEQFEWMLELSQILTAKRQKKGAIDFDMPEPEIVYDVSGEVLDIVQAERNLAHRLIEEFMLLANEAVATCLEEKAIPLIYRIHEDPDPAKVEDFLDVAKGFGLGMERRAEGAYHARDFQKLAGKLAGTREGRFLSYLMLRSFKQARYSEINQGHFGLATANYTHFTSPIRRYPDLIVHRILKWEIEGETFAPEAEALYERLPEIADSSSQRERKAVEAEREIMRWIMAQFMAERLGEEFDAFIIGIKHNGFFVELLDHFVEGFVPVETIWDDFYVFHQQNLIGETTKKVYRPGDQVRVRVDKVNRDRHLIDFSVVLTERMSGPEQRSKRRPKV